MAQRDRISVDENLLHQVQLDANLANRFAGTFIFPTVADFVRGTPDVFIQAFGNPRTNITVVLYGT